MSLAAFDLLRANHSGSGAQIDRLERAVSETLRFDPDAVVDEESLAQQSDVDEDIVYELLVELSSLGALSTRLFWICPNTQGTVKESDSLDGFATTQDCELCGETHAFSSSRIMVHFLASAELVRGLNAAEGL